MRLLLPVLLVLAGCDVVLGLDRKPPDAAPPIDTLPDPTMPVAFYPMEGVTGTRVTDETGRGHDARCLTSTCPTGVAGKVANALAFDGLVQFLTVPSAGDFETSANVTAMAWVYLDRQPDMVASTREFACPFGKRYGNGNQNSWQLCFHYSGRLYFISAHVGGGDTLSKQLDMPIQEWHHVAIRIEGAVKTVFYDGTVFVGATAATGTLALDQKDIVIGGDIDQISNNLFYFPGRIDELKIYATALSDQEIAILAQ